MSPAQTVPRTFRCCAAVFVLMLVLASVPSPALPHDASAYGGVFRSRSMGDSWLNADIGLFLSAALIVAVDPSDPHHLLMGTDTGLFGSVNGGRSWTPEAPGLIAGAAFAVAFAPDGATALCAAPGGVYRFAGGGWRQLAAPLGATPARAITFGSVPGRVYLLGREQLYRSDDGGAEFTALPGDPGGERGMTALAVLRQPVETVFVISGGELMASTDAGRHWRRQAVSDAREPLDTVTTDPAAANRLWVAANDRLHVSDDGGVSWRTVGSNLPEPRTTVRSIAADPEARTLVVATHRGTYRSTDAGEHWTLQEGNLPVHLEAGTLARDPSSPSTLYVVYSLIPYPEVWRNAVEGSNLLARADRVSLIGGAAFLAFLLLSGGTLVAWLARRRDAMADVAR